MSKLGMLLSGIVITIASLALFTDVNLLWHLADFLLTGNIPYFEQSIGFLGSLIVLSVLGFMIMRIFYDARSDLYAKAVEDNKKIQKIHEEAEKISLAEALAEEEKSQDSPGEELEEVAVA